MASPTRAVTRPGLAPGLRFVADAVALSGLLRRFPGCAEGEVKRVALATPARDPVASEGGSLARALAEPWPRGRACFSVKISTWAAKLGRSCRVWTIQFD